MNGHNIAENNGHLNLRLPGPRIVILRGGSEGRQGTLKFVSVLQLISSVNLPISYSLTRSVGILASLATSQSMFLKIKI